MRICWGKGYSVVGSCYLESFWLLYPHFFLLRGYLLLYALFLSFMTRLWWILFAVVLPRVLFIVQPCGSFTYCFPSLLSFVPFLFLNVRHTFVQCYFLEVLFGRLFITGDGYPVLGRLGSTIRLPSTHDQLPPHSLPDAFRKPG